MGNRKAPNPLPKWPKPAPPPPPPRARDTSLELTAREVMVEVVGAIRRADQEQLLAIPLDPVNGLTTYAPDWPPFFRMRMVDGSACDVLISKREF